MLAIYTRVSTVLQAERGTSMATQLEQCVKKAQELGYGSWQVYADEGFSGMDLDRPGITRLREDIAKGLVTALICWDVDRLARGTVYQLLILEEIRKKKVDLIFVNTNWQDTPEGRLLFQMQSIIAEYELAKIKLRTTWGRLRCARNGRVMPMRTAPFGYDYDPQQGLLMVNQEEAPFVQMIYRWYVFDHLSLREIGQKLVELGARAKGGGTWSASSIRSILRSPVYTGKFYYNRRETRIKENGGRTPAGYKRRESSLRDPSEWIEIKVPALISEDLFARAQEQARRNCTVYKGNAKFPYLCKGLLRCGECGRTWQGTTTGGGGRTGKRAYSFYRCPGKNPRSYGEGVKKCTTPSISGQRLDDFVWQEIAGRLANPELLLRLLHSRREGDPAPKQQLALVERALRLAEREKEKLVRLYQLDQLTDAEIELHLGRLKEKTKKLAAERQGLIEKITARERELRDGLAFSSLSREMAGLIREGLTFQEKRKLLEMLVTEIAIYFEGPKVILQLRGQIEKLGYCLQPQEV